MKDGAESVDDILREMRRMPIDIIVDANANFVFRRYADRIETALRNEKDETASSISKYSMMLKRCEEVRRANASHISYVNPRELVDFIEKGPCDGAR